MNEEFYQKSLSSQITKELATALKAYLQNPHLDTEERKALTQRYFWKCDGKSSERLANFLLEELSLPI